jgi:hypothetical protein
MDHLFHFCSRKAWGGRKTRSTFHLFAAVAQKEQCSDWRFVPFVSASN